MYRTRQRGQALRHIEREEKEKGYGAALHFLLRDKGQIDGTSELLRDDLSLLRLNSQSRIHWTS